MPQLPYSLASFANVILAYQPTPKLINVRKKKKSLDVDSIDRFRNPNKEFKNE